MGSGQSKKGTWGGGGLTNVYFYISLWAVRVRPEVGGWGVKGQFDFFCLGGGQAGKVGKSIFFFSNLFGFHCF